MKSYEKVHQYESDDCTSAGVPISTKPLKITIEKNKNIVILLN